MDADILAPFRSGGAGDLSDFRASISRDPESLQKAAYLWLNASCEMLGPISDHLEYSDGPIEHTPSIEIPTGYGELTYVLMWWCDQSPFNIDATPLVDFLVAMDDLRQDDWHVGSPAALFNARKAESRAKHVIYRMLNAAFIAVGKEPPPRSERPSRNPERDNWICEQDENGKTLEEIRAAIPSQNSDWWPLDTEQAVFGVLKRRGRR